MFCGVANSSEAMEYIRGLEKRTQSFRRDWLLPPSSIITIIPVCPPYLPHLFYITASILYNQIDKAVLVPYCF